MFVVDQFLLSLSKRILEAAEAEGPSPSKLRAELQELYRGLETGQVSEVEFDAHEGRILAQLEELEARTRSLADDEVDDEDDDEVDDEADDEVDDEADDEADDDSAAEADDDEPCEGADADEEEGAVGSTRLGGGTAKAGGPWGGTA